MNSPNEQTIESENEFTSGIVRQLGDLPEGAIINEEALAKMFDRCQVSIKRAIQRGELPAPVKLLGMPVWTVGKLLDHINERLDIAQKEEQRTRKKFQDLDI